MNSISIKNINNFLAENEAITAVLKKTGPAGAMLIIGVAAVGVARELGLKALDNNSHFELKFNKEGFAYVVN